MARDPVALPSGVELYSFGADGTVVVTGERGAEPLGPGPDLLPFIDDGQFARYLIGDAKTSPQRPSNATFKLGLVAPHSAFTPHAHAGEHFVLSLGHGSCGLHDAGRVTTLALRPGTMIRIPAMMPHSFGNRAGSPLVILAANTGYGIDHEDYAITAAAARERGDDDLAAALVRLDGHAAPPAGWRERAATGLRRLAARLDSHADAAS
jgi:mannose-6-phosphate isomerase-like protein (cupin superfamily)